VPVTSATASDLRRKIDDIFGRLDINNDGQISFAGLVQSNLI
jgi:Ca2+-binding EF-hand superfamily protein